VSIIVNNLTKVYGKQYAVNHVSFEIGTGEIVGFLGPNGAGKSTTMKIITGYIPPTEGGGTVCGIDFVEESIEVRKIIGYLPEHNPLYLDMYVKEYLAFMAGLAGIKGSQISKSVDLALDLTNLHPEKQKKIGQLSKGYRQRVGLAQALIHNPKVLILDEPTSGLDPNQVIEMRNVITQLGKEKTVLLSTHIMQEVEAMCSKVMIINQGNIIANDTIEILQNSGNDTLTVIVEFGAPCSKSDLAKIDGILSIENISGNRWRINGKSSHIRQHLSQFAMSKNIEILELTSDKNSLEDIFRNLTNHVGHI
jgi:ABC-2 type transport system ATP-binding protein